MKAAPADALVFYGATGDLAFKKIFPALQNLVRRGALDVAGDRRGPVGSGARATSRRARERA